MTCGLKIVLVSRPGHAVSLFWRVFFKVPEVFHVHNFHKPAKTSIIAPKPYSFFVESDATFDIGGSWNVDWKWFSWVGQAMQFPRFEGFFSRSQRSSMSTTSTSLPKPALSYQNLLFFSGVRRNVWHRRRMKCGSKMDLVSRPDHAVSPFWRVFFKAPEVFLVYNFHKPAKTSIIVPKPYSFLVDSDATFDTGGGWHVDWKSSSWVGQAMQFPCFEGFFFKVPEVFLVYNFHKPAKTSIIVPKPYSFLVESDATFDIGGGWNAVRKWTSWVGQTMLFPCFEGFFFKVPEVFLVYNFHIYNFHKPAKTSIIAPKPYSFFVESDATFDIGGGWNAVRKWTSWVGQTMLFPCSEGFFFKAPEVFLVYNFHKPAKTSIIVPKPYNFLVDSDATFDTGGGWHVDWKSSSWVGQAMQFPCFEGFFSRSQRSSMSTTSTSLPKPALSYQNLIIISGFRRNVWHRRRMTCGLKIVLVSRPGHAVSLFWRVFFQGPRGLPCPQLP